MWVRSAEVSVMRLVKRINQLCLTGLFARAGAALLLAAGLATAAVGVQTITATPAWAASGSARGPSAAADRFNNQYVFWKGTDNNLWEGFYNNYTGRWNGPIGLGMGTLVSEPSVAVSPTQVFAGPGGKPFSAQFVYWEGLNNSLFMAYWEGSWHGPIEITLGNGIQALACSQPSAAILNPPSGLNTVIYWKGIASSVNGSCDGHLYYAYSNSPNPISAADYFGPVYASEAGNIGSSPSVAGGYTASPTTGGLCLCQVMVAWQGTDGNLWSETYPVGGQVSGPTIDHNSAGLGSAPSIVGFGSINSVEQSIFDIVWRGGGSEHLLWYANFTASTGTYSASQAVGNSGALGSAPTVAEDTYYVQNEYVFWKSSASAADLWEGFYDGVISNPTWYIIHLGMGPEG